MQICIRFRNVEIGLSHIRINRMYYFFFLTCHFCRGTVLSKHSKCKPCQITELMNFVGLLRVSKYLASKKLDIWFIFKRSISQERSLARAQSRGNFAPFQIASEIFRRENIGTRVLLKYQQRQKQVMQCIQTSKICLETLNGMLCTNTFYLILNFSHMNISKERNQALFCYRHKFKKNIEQGVENLPNDYSMKANLIQ